MASTSFPSSDLFNRCVWTKTAPTRVAMSVTTAPSAVLTPGKLYVVCADVVWHMKQGRFSATQVTATTNDLPLGAYEKIYVWCSETDLDDCVAGILPSGTGNMYVKEVA